jgi:hypothetical protein
MPLQIDENLIAILEFNLQKPRTKEQLEKGFVTLSSDNKK